MNVLPRRLAALLVLPAVGLAACGGGGSTGAAATSSSASPTTSTSPTPTVAAATAPVLKTKAGVTVTGVFGQKPALTIPAGNAPTALAAEVLSQGKGAAIASGQTLVVNYLGETWDPQSGKPNIFDNSYDRKTPAGFQIGTGAVITGWDKTLVGQHVGSRLLLTIPPAEGYGATADASNALAGHTLVFVVDILDALAVNTASTGTAVTSVTAGMPAVTSESGKKPAITSVKGVKTVTTPTSALLIKGAGAAIDPTKTLALEIIQTDAATGKQTQQTWGPGSSSSPPSRCSRSPTR